MKNKAGGFTDCSAGFTSSINPVQSNSAKRKYQKQILKKSIEAIDTFPIADRSHSGMTMAIHRKKIPQVKELIQTFRRNVAELLNDGSDKDAVYQLAISFFPLSQTDPNPTPGEQV